MTMQSLNLHTTHHTDPLLLSKHNAIFLKRVCIEFDLIEDDYHLTLPRVDQSLANITTQTNNDINPNVYTCINWVQLLNDIYSVLCEPISTPLTTNRSVGPYPHQSIKVENWIKYCSNYIINTPTPLSQTNSSTVNLNTNDYTDSTQDIDSNMLGNDVDDDDINRLNSYAVQLYRFDIIITLIINAQHRPSYTTPKDSHIKDLVQAITPSSPNRYFYPYEITLYDFFRSPAHLTILVNLIIPLSTLPTARGITPTYAHFVLPKIQIPTLFLLDEFLFDELNLSEGGWINRKIDHLKFPHQQTPLDQDIHYHSNHNSVIVANNTRMMITNNNDNNNNNKNDPKQRVTKQKYDLFSFYIWSPFPSANSIHEPSERDLYSHIDVISRSFHQKGYMQGQKIRGEFSHCAELLEMVQLSFTHRLPLLPTTLISISRWINELHVSNTSKVLERINGKKNINSINHTRYTPSLIRLGFSERSLSLSLMYIDLCQLSGCTHLIQLIQDCFGLYNHSRLSTLLSNHSLHDMYQSSTRYGYLTPIQTIKLMIAHPAMHKMFRTATMGLREWLVEKFPVLSGSINGTIDSSLSLIITQDHIDDSFIVKMKNNLNRDDVNINENNGKNRVDKHQQFIEAVGFSYNRLSDANPSEFSRPEPTQTLFTTTNQQTSLGYYCPLESDQSQYLPSLSTNQSRHFAEIVNKLNPLMQKIHHNPPQRYINDEPVTLANTPQISLISNGVNQNNHINSDNHENNNNNNKDNNNTGPLYHPLVPRSHLNLLGNGINNTTSQSSHFELKDVAAVYKPQSSPPAPQSQHVVSPPNLESEDQPISPTQLTIPSFSAGSFDLSLTPPRTPQISVRESLVCPRRHRQNDQHERVIVGGSAPPIPARILTLKMDDSPLISPIPSIPQQLELTKDNVEVAIVEYYHTVHHARQHIFQTIYTIFSYIQQQLSSLISIWSQPQVSYERVLVQIDNLNDNNKITNKPLITTNNDGNNSDNGSNNPQYPPFSLPDPPPAQENRNRPFMAGLPPPQPPPPPPRYFPLPPQNRHPPPLLPILHHNRPQPILLHHNQPPMQPRMLLNFVDDELPIPLPPLHRPNFLKKVTKAVFTTAEWESFRIHYTLLFEVLGAFPFHQFKMDIHAQNVVIESHPDKSKGDQTQNNNIHIAISTLNDIPFLDHFPFEALDGKDRPTAPRRAYVLGYIRLTTRLMRLFQPFPIQQVELLQAITKSNYYQSFLPQSTEATREGGILADLDITDGVFTLVPFRRTMGMLESHYNELSSNINRNNNNNNIDNTQIKPSTQHYNTKVFDHPNNIWHFYPVFFQTLQDTIINPISQQFHLNSDILSLYHNPNTLRDDLMQICEQIIGDRFDTGPSMPKRYPVDSHYHHTNIQSILRSLGQAFITDKTIGKAMIYSTHHELNRYKQTSTFKGGTLSYSETQLLGSVGYENDPSSLTPPRPIGLDKAEAIYEFLVELYMSYLLLSDGNRS